MAKVSKSVLKKRGKRLVVTIVPNSSETSSYNEIPPATYSKRLDIVDLAKSRKNKREFA